MIGEIMLQLGILYHHLTPTTKNVLSLVESWASQPLWKPRTLQGIAKIVSYIPNSDRKALLKTHLRHKAWRNLARAQLKPSLVLTSFHSSRRYFSHYR